MKAQKFWSIFKPAGIDFFVLTVIGLTMFYPDRSGVIAKIFSVDNLFAFDADITAPAWAFYKGCLLNIDVNSRYGIGIPILAATFCRMTGEFSYENILLFINLATIVYLFVCYRFLLTWTGHCGVAILGLILILKFRFDNHLDFPVHPAASVLRHYFDVIFFICLGKHLASENVKYLLAAGIFVSLAIFAMVDTGVYLFATLAVYLGLQNFLPSPRVSTPETLRRRWKHTVASIVFPLVLTVILFVYFSEGHLAAFLQNTFEFNRLFRAGFGSIPFWENVGDVVPFIIGIMVPVLLLVTFCLVVVFIRINYLFRRHLLGAVIAFYGLSCWHYYICRPYVGSMNYFAVPVIFILCFWLTRAIESRSLQKRLGAVHSIFVVGLPILSALFLLLTTPRFIQSPNLLNLIRDDLRKERTKMRRGFINPEDVRMIRELTGPEDRAAILSSFETALLMRADRRPYFYYMPIFQNAPMNTKDFYAMYTATYRSLEKMSNEIRVNPPRYIFVEKKIHDRLIEEHIPMAFEPMFFLQESDIRKQYRQVRKGKYLVALERIVEADKDQADGNFEKLRVKTPIGLPKN